MPAIRPAVMLAALVLAGASAAFAQSVPPAPTAGDAQAGQALTLDTPIKDIVAVPQAKAVLDADIPGLTEHPMFDKFKHENLRTLAPKFGGAISPKALAKTQADLAALSPSATSR